MKSPFDFFDKIYCINLPNDTDRWAHAVIQFEKIGILDRVEKIYATPPHKDINVPSLKFPRGEMGVSLSQNKVIMNALISGANNVLIFEDDIVFEADTINKLETALAELPEDWDILFFGGNPVEGMSKYSSTLNKTKVFYGAFAYALTRQSMLKIINQFFDKLTIMPYDGLTSNISLEGNGYVINTPICWPHPGESVIRKAYRDYTNFLKNQWKPYI